MRQKEKKRKATCCGPQRLNAQQTTFTLILVCRELVAGRQRVSFCRRRQIWRMSTLGTVARSVIFEFGTESMTKQMQDMTFV